MSTTTEREITVADGLGNADASQVLYGATFSSESGFNQEGAFVPDASNITYNDGTVADTLDDLVENGVKVNDGTELTDILPSGQTTITFTSEEITNDSKLNAVYTSIFDVQLESASFGDGTLTLVFPAQEEDMEVVALINATSSGDDIVAREVMDELNDVKGAITDTVLPRYKKIKLLSSGWYRIAKMECHSEADANGGGNNSCDIEIKRMYNTISPEYKKIKLVSLYENSSFVDEISKSATDNANTITKIRHTVDTTNNTNYIEVYYKADSENNMFITLNNHFNVYVLAWKLIEPESTEETVDGITVLGSHNFTTNYDNQTQIANNDDELARVKSTVGDTKKNLLPNTVSTTTTTGVTLTVNSNKSVTLNGTSTDKTYFKIGNITLKKGRYKLSGCLDGAAGKHSMYLVEPYISCLDKEVEFELSEDITSEVIIYVASGVTINTTFYPMIRYASISDGTYEPYVEDLDTRVDSLSDEVADLKKSVADGKELLATTISDYGYTTVASDATFEEINTGINTTVESVVVPNGRVWTKCNIGNSWDNVCYAKGLWVAGNSNNGGAYYSTDGINWTQSDYTNDCSIVGYADGIWVLSTDNARGLWYSTNGMNWTQSNLTNDHAWKGMHNANGIWVIGSNNDGGLYYSTDGMNWARSNITSGTFYSIYNGKGIWVAGGSSENGLYYSTDGKTWTQSNITSNNFYRVHYSDGIWVASSNTQGIGLYYSTDGKTWTQSNRTSGKFYGVYCAYGTWVACSGYSEGLYYSTDGINWTRSSVSNGSFSDVYNANGMWVAGQNSGGLYYSTDGINWTRSNITSSSFNKIYNANGMWLAIAGGSSMYYSKSL